MAADLLLTLPLLFFSIILHEYAHGAVAERFGDDTARVMGRLTLNPLPHIDIVGTIILPAVCMLTNAPMFGWAKPVPVNPYRLSNKPISIVLVAAAGPLSNFFLAAICALAMQVVTHTMTPTDSQMLLLRCLNYGTLVNLYLCVFNLLPIPPLDGSKLLEAALPGRFSDFYARIAPNGFMIIMLLMMTGFFGKVISPIVMLLYRMLMG